MLPVVKEHDRLESGDPEVQEQLIALARKTKNRDTEHETLGLHLISGEEPYPSVWWFVGQVCLTLGNKRKMLRVDPKVNVAPVQMYAECLTHPIVRAHLDDCMYFYWNEPAIRVEDRNHPITPLIVMRYLCLLHELCQRHLRAMITPVEANLIGRIKGKPLVQPTLRMDHARGRLDRTYCRFQVQSMDTIPNQILTAALHQAIKYLHQSGLGDPALFHLSAFSANALSGVTVRRILPTDFQGLQYGGFLRPYREPHRWARLVLRALGPDPLEEIAEDQKTDLPPFAIDMKELFERYCEVKLRNVSNQNVWAGYKHNNLGSRLRIRPDFLVRAGGKRWVVDAKYKEDWSWRENEQRDVYQIVSYCAHKAVLRQLDLDQNTDERPIAVI
jgi:5-methylcytosine-specific restriction enzyme subunit McrC